MQFKTITDVTTEPVSLAEARLHLKISASDTSEDTLLGVWITTARELAEQYTERALASRTLEAALDQFPCNPSAAWSPDGLNRARRDCIDLPMPPVTSIVSVKYTDPAGVAQTMPSTDYALSTYGDSRRISLTFGKSWPATQCIPNAVRIQFIAGYGVSGGPTTPQAVKSALLLMIGWLHEHRGDEMDPEDIQPPAAKALLWASKICSF